MKFDNKTILVKHQPTVDVDPTPAGSNAADSENLSWTYYAGNIITKNKDKPHFGANEKVNVSPRTEFSLDVELSQATAAGTVPAFGPLLRACAMSETIDIGVDVRYAPVSSGEERCAVYFIDDNAQEQRSINCKGNMSIEMNAESLPMIKFTNFMGSYNKPIAAAVYTVDTSAWEDSVPVTKENTVTLTLDGYVGCVNSFVVDLGNTVEAHNEPNCAGTDVTARETTGTIVIKAPDIGAKDFFAIMESHSGSVNTVAIAVEHGDGVRPNLFINLPQVQLNDMQRTDIRGELYYTIPFTALPTDAGNDELELIF